MISKIKIGIVGGAGYTAGELIRVLLNHPNAEIVFVQSKSNAGNKVNFIHQDLIADTNLIFTDVVSNNIDVLFLCLAHGEAKKFFTENNILSSIKIIDLSNDFRLVENSNIGDRNFIYGLPELNREDIKVAQNIANPGCFATAIQLALLPLATAKMLPAEIYTTGITGSTGAGQSLSITTHFSWRQNNIQAYKSLTHQHLHEINQSLNILQPSFDTNTGGVHFIPWRGDFTKGIFTSTQLQTNLNLAELNSLYNNYYANHPFAFVSEVPIFLKQIINTNNCILQLEKIGKMLVIHSAIDNLIKGASGQAVQNMNLMFGLDETTGLKLKASFF
jgi:N-acetyl-gamma-glutamyl-phosphate reductase